MLAIWATTNDDQRPSKQLTSLAHDGTFVVERTPHRTMGIGQELVRMKVVLYCNSCGIPRCLWSKRDLTDDETVEVENVTDCLEYGCGGPVLPEGHPLYEVIQTAVSGVTADCRYGVETEYWKLVRAGTATKICAQCYDATEEWAEPPTPLV